MLLVLDWRNAGSDALLNVALLAQSSVWGIECSLVGSCGVRLEESRGRSSVDSGSNRSIFLSLLGVHAYLASHDPHSEAGQ